MKKIGMLVLMSLSLISVFSQKVKEMEVPSVVKAALTKDFPKAMHVQWNKEENQYEASFDLNKIDHSVLFDANGKKMEEEAEIEEDELPKGIQEYVTMHYKQKVKEAARITDEKGTITYEAEIKGMDLIFDSTGKFLKEVKD